jgi:hypothetical protein
LLGNRARRAEDSCTNSIADDYSEAEADAEYAQQLAALLALFADDRLGRIFQMITSKRNETNTMDAKRIYFSFTPGFRSCEKIIGPEYYSSYGNSQVGKGAVDRFKVR